MTGFSRKTKYISAIAERSSDAIEKKREIWYN